MKTGSAAPQRLLFRAILIAMVASGATSFAGPPSQESPAAKQFGAWLAAFNKGDRSTLLAYHQQSFPYSAASRDVADIEHELGLSHGTGGFVIKKSESASPTSFSVVLKERQPFGQFARATM